MRKLILNGVILGIFFEIITIIFRFYFGLESTRDTTIISQFTAGIRIHHGYIGFLLLLITGFKMVPPDANRHTKLSVSHWLFSIGIGLILSDIAHHFIILWMTTGDPQFDLMYPALR
ncbi:hypothetical protein [Neptunomonas sp.]|uniref:hypothetical protein n=1 Tax=Neptunomonas sp. TaxID=1971898 RepID=UPI00356A064E